jgi:hypothetical protein
MTYTFKLARRLAMSRDLTMVTALILLAACAGDTTGPEPTSTTINTASNAGLRLVPRTATIETNQRIRFRGEPLRGRDRVTDLAWSATGGATITTNGIFSASTAGTYKVVGRGRGRNKSDTSTVIVVPPPTDLVGIEASPDSVALAAGANQTFTALGRLSDGTTTSVGVTWTAAGGAIDAGGVFTAGNAGGKFRVVATKSSGTLADTADVTITVSAPVDTTPPAPAPTLASVILSPASVSLVSSGTQKFTAYGRNSVGDSVAVAVTYAASGGTINSTGLYTAGSTGGTFRVVAAVSGISDTSIVSVSAPAPSPTPVGSGLPFGPYRLMSSTSTTTPFTLSAEFNSPSTIVTQISNARSRGVSIMLAMTGGAHKATNPGCCLSVIDGVLQFDRAKWDATLATFNTATIRQAIASGVADGTIIGATVMDEPFVHGGGDGNTWGPVGTMTKARVDSLCTEVKRYFPTTPAGVEHQHQLFEPTKSYKVCDFIVDQYNAFMGSVTTWRDAGLAMAARDHHAILFSMNVLNGGTQDKDGTWDCTGTGGKGLYSPNCRMTAAQVKTFGLALGPSGCGLFMWRYDDAFATNYDNQRSFNDIAATMAAAPAKACRRG